MNFLSCFQNRACMEKQDCLFVGQRAIFATQRISNVSKQRLDAEVCSSTRQGQRIFDSTQIRSERLLNRFLRKERLQKFVRKQYPRVSRDFIADVISASIEVLLIKLQDNQIQAASRFLATGQISRSEYLQFAAFVYETTRRVALKTYREAWSEWHKTNIDDTVLNSIEGDVNDDESDDWIGSSEFLLLFSRGLHHSRCVLDSICFDILKRRLRGDTFGEIGAAIKIDRNKAAAAFRKAATVIGNFLEGEICPRTYGCFLAKLRREKPKNISAIHATDPSTELVVRTVTYLNREQRSCRSTLSVEATGAGKVDSELSDETVIGAIHQSALEKSPCLPKAV